MRRRRRQQRATPRAVRRLPALNALVGLELPGHAEPVASRVEDVQGDALWLARPSDAGAEPPRAALTVRWTSDEGLWRLPVAYQGLVEQPVPQWHVTATAEPERSQRRDGFRVPVMGSVTLHLGQVAWSARTVDLSEGGLRCRLPLDAPVRPDREVLVSLDLVERGLTLPGEVVRYHEHEGALDVGLRLDPPSEQVAEQLRRFLLAEQIRQRNAAP